MFRRNKEKKKKKKVDKKLKEIEQIKKDILKIDPMQKLAEDPSPEAPVEPSEDSPEGDPKTTAELGTKDNPRKVKLSETFVKTNKKLKDSIEAGEVKEPILMLIQTNGKVEVWENVEAGYLELERTDKEDAVLTLDESKLLSFEWGSARIRGWIHYENETAPYPSDVQQDSVIFRKLISKMILNVENYKAQKLDALGGTIFKILLGIGAIIFIAGIFVLPNLPAEFWEAGKEVATNPAVQETVSNITRNATTLSRTVIG